MAMSGDVMMTNNEANGEIINGLNPIEENDNG
jgi:hypothetical protein